jgi:hypothetical protein
MDFISDSYSSRVESGLFNAGIAINTTGDE